MKNTFTNLEEIYSDRRSAVAVIKSRLKITTTEELVLCNPEMIRFQGLDSFMTDIVERLGVRKLKLRDDNEPIQMAVLRQFKSMQKAPIRVLNFSIRGSVVKVRPLRFIPELERMTSPSLVVSDVFKPNEGMKANLDYLNATDSLKRRLKEWGLTVK